MDGPVILHLDRPGAVRLMNAAINESWLFKDSDPDLAARLLGDAHRIQRHLFAVRPIAYRPAPVDVQIEGPNVTAMVSEYGGDAA